jgi:hypothetical protein
MLIPYTYVYNMHNIAEKRCRISIAAVRIRDGSLVIYKCKLIKIVHFTLYRLPCQLQ